MSDEHPSEDARHSGDPADMGDVVDFLRRTAGERALPHDVGAQAVARMVIVPVQDGRLRPEEATRLADVAPHPGGVAQVSPPSPSADVLPLQRPSEPNQ